VNVKDVTSLGPLSEGMRVQSADGALVGTVIGVWGGFANLGSAHEMEMASGVGAGVEGGPDVRDLPEGTSTIGQTRPGYLEVGAADGRTLYMPLADVADVRDNDVVLSVTRGEIGERYEIDPSGS